MVKLAYTQSHAKGSTRMCLLSNGLWKKQVSRDSSYNRQNNHIYMNIQLHFSLHMT